MAVHRSRIKITSLISIFIGSHHEEPSQIVENKVSNESIISMLKTKKLEND